MKDPITEEERERCQRLAEEIHAIVKERPMNDVIFALTALLCDAARVCEIDKKRLVSHFANYADLYYERYIKTGIKS